MTPSINAAAFAVAETRSVAEGTGATVATKADALNVISARIAALDAERSGIVSTRKAGGDDPSHGSRLALIAADREGLQELMVEAEAELATARTADQAAAQTLGTAEFGLARESDREMIRRLASHASKLDEILLTTILDLAARAQNLGSGRPMWMPSPALALELRRLDLDRASFGALP